MYKPPGFTPGHRYPLVIQTHGFKEDAFIPSGIYPTAFAARALANAGIMVLQARGCPIISGNPEEAPCNAAGYAAAVRQLQQDGLIDARRVGLVGFSRTCYYVLEALTKTDAQWAAASITDGVNLGYFQYLLATDDNPDVQTEGNAINGGPLSAKRCKAGWRVPRPSISRR